MGHVAKPGSEVHDARMDTVADRIRLALYTAGDASPDAEILADSILDDLYKLEPEYEDRDMRRVL